MPEPKYNIGDMFIFPDIFIQHYHADKVNNSVAFVTCVGVLIRIDYLNNNFTYFLEIEDKYIESNGLTLTIGFTEETINTFTRVNQ